MITTKGRTMNRLSELKQKTPSFGLRKRRSRRVGARGLASCRSISGSRFVRRAYEQTNVGLQPVVGQRLKEAVKKKTAPPPKRVILLLLLLSTLFWAAGCEDYYNSSPGYYGPALYSGGGSVDVAVRDRRYYRGPGYWYGRAYYVWEPGHWAWRTGAGSPSRGAAAPLPGPGQLLWIHGHYIARGY
jgi:WXXGXW repeat (2 copies)